MTNNVIFRALAQVDQNSFESVPGLSKKKIMVG